MVKIGSCTVIYNPNEEVISNIERYCNHVDVAVVVDNSDKKNDVCNKLENDSRLHYIDMDGNKGIAAALNRGFDFLNNYKVDFVLTMDQDSVFPEKEYSNILNLVEKYSGEYSIITLRYDGKEELHNSDIVEVPLWITSGNFVNIKDYYLVGGFREDLFIDYVDHDFCHSLYLKGLKIGYLKGYSLKHKLGNPVEGKNIWKKVFFDESLPIRYYYRYRNCFYLAHQDKNFYHSLFKDEFFRPVRMEIA